MRSMKTMVAVAAIIAGAFGVIGALPAAAASGPAAAPASSASAQVADANNSVQPFVNSHLSSDYYGATGRCYSDLCLYYNSGEGGAVRGFNNEVPNLAGYTFPDNGNGHGLPVKNDAASAENQSPGTDDIYYNSNYSGDYDWLNPASYGQLYYTYNNDASLQVG